MLIGLLGVKGCGKDTAAAYLGQHGFIRMAFADDLYEEVAAAFGVTPHFLARREYKETPLERLSLQYCQAPEFRGIFSERERLRMSKEAGRQIDREEVLRLPRSPRWLLQQWGYEYRLVEPTGHSRYWVDRVARKVDAKPRSANVVLSDVRTPSEAQLVRVRGGALVRVHRASVEAEEAKSRARGILSALHATETCPSVLPVDLEVDNPEGNPQAMYEALDAFLVRLKSAA